MRVLASLAFVLGVVLPACSTEDPLPVYVDIDYQVRCLDCVPLAVDYPARRIRHVDGEADYEISCAVREGERRAVTFEVDYRDPDNSSRRHRLQVNSALIDGKDPGKSCRVRVVEGNTTFEGRCTSGDPTAEETCKVSFDVEDDVLKGRIYCDEITSTAMLSTKRYLVQSGTVDEPVEFELQGCDGL